MVLESFRCDVLSDVTVAQYFFQGPLLANYSKRDPSANWLEELVDLDLTL